MLARTRAEHSAHPGEEILSGRMATGETLPSEREPAERHRVSRPVVRAALRRLIERNLVEAVPGRSTYVRATHPADAAFGIEALLRRSQQRPANETAMVDALDRFDEATGLLEQTRFDLAFHLAIARWNAWHNAR